MHPKPQYCKQNIPTTLKKRWLESWLGVWAKAKWVRYLVAVHVFLLRRGALVGRGLDLNAPHRHSQDQLSDQGHGARVLHRAHLHLDPPRLALRWGENDSNGSHFTGFYLSMWAAEPQLLCKTKQNNQWTSIGKGVMRVCFALLRFKTWIWFLFVSSTNRQISASYALGFT